jgi:hypothetical protein
LSLSKSQGSSGAVVVVDAPGTVVVDEDAETVAGSQRSCAPLNVTTRAPPRASVTVADVEDGRPQRSG